MGENQNSQNQPGGGSPGGDGQGFWDDKTLMEMLNRAITLQHRYLRQQTRSYCGDPHRGQGRVLSILRIKPEISQKDLGYLLDMRSQSLGELLMKLERAGYVTRTPAGDDRRVMMVRLTELGQAAAEQAEKSQDGGSRFFDCLSAEEQEIFRACLKKIIITLERGLAQEPGPQGQSYSYDPFWGVGDGFGEGIKECCHKHKHDIKAHSRALRHHLQEQGRELRRQGRELREEMRRDPRLRGVFWGDWGDWCCGPDGYDGGQGPGNGPRP